MSELPLNKNKETQWLNSKSAMTQLKISACELMHQRESGKHIFEKRGNAYFYLIPHKGNPTKTESK